MELDYSVCAAKGDMNTWAFSPPPLAQLSLSSGFCPVRDAIQPPSLRNQIPDASLGAGTAQLSKTPFPVLLSSPLCTSKPLATYMSFFHSVFPLGAFIMSWAQGILNGRKTGNLTSLKFRRPCQGLFTGGHHTRRVWGAVPDGSPRSRTESISGLRAELCQRPALVGGGRQSRDFPRATVVPGQGSPWDRWAPRGGSAPATPCPALGPCLGSSFKFLSPSGLLCFPSHAAQ